MAKVSIGLRGWRFEESEVFTDGETFKPLSAMPEDTRHRLLRLASLVEEPCDACYLTHGEAEKHRCMPAQIVYGEPFDEVVLCDEHEPDFLYWFREDGGADLAGTDEFANAFHEWYADGGRAPEDYGGLEHVETDPATLPDLPDPEEIHEQLNEGFEAERIDILSEAEAAELTAREAERRAEDDGTDSTDLTFEVRASDWDDEPGGDEE